MRAGIRTGTGIGISEELHDALCGLPIEREGAKGEDLRCRTTRSCSQWLRVAEAATPGEASMWHGWFGMLQVTSLGVYGTALLVR